MDWAAAKELLHIEGWLEFSPGVDSPATMQWRIDSCRRPAWIEATVAGRSDE